MDLNDWLDGSQLVVCVGSGGAGKTTAAAAIGLWSAVRGDRTLVVTVDPAKRLANSLGLAGFSEDETRIDVPGAKGELWAVMIDSRRTFDTLIRKVAPTVEVRDRVLKNRIYRHMADTFAGSQEYMATEKLYDAMQSGRYDRIVLDTPPVKNALDFLESPTRLINFLDERVLKWFLRPPPRGVRRLVAGTSSVLYYLLGQVFGHDFLDDLGGFFRDFEGMYEGFRTRHEAVVAKLRAEGTFFVTVCAATDPSVDVAVFFEEELAARGLPRGGIIVNQVHHADATEHDAAEVLGELARAAAKDLPGPVVPAVLARLGMAHRRLHDLTVAERAIEERLRIAGQGGGFLAHVPRLDGQVHDLDGLRRVGEALFGPTAR